MDPYEADRKPSIIKPVLIGGIVGGVLGIVPGVMSCNCCCCLWFAVGGIISVLIYRSMAPYSLTAGMGGLLGLVSGIISGLVTSFGFFIASRSQLSDPDFYDPESARTQEAVTLIRDMYGRIGFSDIQIDDMVNMYYSFITSMTPESAMMNVILSLVALTVAGTIVSVIAGMITAAIAGKRQEYPEEPPPYQP